MPAQSIFYDYSTYSYFLREEGKGWKNFKYQPTYYTRVKEDQEDALPILTGGWAIPSQKYDKNNPHLLEKDINRELVLLRDLYFEEEDGDIPNHNIVYLDIEIEMGGSLTPEYIKAASMPFTSIALIDVVTKTKICFIIDPNNDVKNINQDGKIIISCKNEKELILKFLDKWEELDPTIMVGWNSEYFDVPYSYYRIQKILGDEVLRLSPIKKITVKDFNGENQVRIGGINHLDYMLLFKKYITKEEPSYKLGDIGLKYVELGKIEYEGNLNTLFKEDINKFIDYNLRDVDIIEKLEDKLKFIGLTIMISHICNIPYEQVYFSTILGEGAILKELKKQGIVSPNKPTTHNPFRKGREETYAGGYLLDPIPGLYYDCIDEDVTSLYPSIIKTLNLGIETLVGRIQVPTNYEQGYSLEKLKERDPNEIVTVEKLDKTDYTLRQAEIKLSSLIKIIEDNKYSISSSGAFFRTDVESVSSSILKKWFKKREYYRGLKKEAGKNKDWDKYKLYDLYQHAFKILQNGHYGTYAKNGFRYTDGYMICSSAITNTGQVIIKSSLEFINNKLSNVMKMNKEELQNYFNI